VKQPEAVHELQVGKLQEWLDGGPKKPERVTDRSRFERIWRALNSMAKFDITRNRCPYKRRSESPERP